MTGYAIIRLVTSSNANIKLMCPIETSQKPHTILLVDDAQSVRESLSWLIENESDLTVIGSASNGEDGLNLAAELHPDLVILDIEMPDMDGFMVASKLKAMSNPPLVILLSVYGDPALRERGNHAGCNAYVEKGQGWPALLEAMRQVLAD
jgi:DNA-binding NarL/FixJ family response regulator